VAEDFKVTLVDSSNAPLADMVVYLQPLDDIVLPVSDKIVEIGQLDRAFSPYINVMQLGNSANFQNKDDITHHIYSPVGENKFSFKIRAGQSQHKSDFKQLGEVAMGCNIHDWMSGYLYIVDTPLFGKTNLQGIVNIPIEQVGKYQLVIWHPQLETQTHSVSQPIEWPKTEQITISIPHKISKVSEQKNEDDFDFLSDY
jgi:hypothetical protein